MSKYKTVWYSIPIFNHIKRTFTNVWVLQKYIVMQDKHYISFKHFIHCSDVSIVEFEEKNPGWVYATSITGASLPDKPSIWLN